MTAPVEVSDEVMVGVVSLPHGWGHDRPGMQLQVASEHAGVSVNDVTDDTFSVLIIPHTLKATMLGRLGVGDAVNLEVDLMARYAARLMERS